MARPSQLRTRAAAQAVPSAAAVTRRRTVSGSTRMSLLKNTSTSPVAAATPAVFPPVKPWFEASGTTRTRGCSRAIHSTVPSVEPLSTTTTSSRSAG